MIEVDTEVVRQMVETHLNNAGASLTTHDNRYVVSGFTSAVSAFVLCEMMLDAGSSTGSTWYELRAQAARLVFSYKESYHLVSTSAANGIEEETKKHAIKVDHKSKAAKRYTPAQKQEVIDYINLGQPKGLSATEWINQLCEIHGMSQGVVYGLVTKVKHEKATNGTKS